MSIFDFVLTEQALDKANARAWKILDSFEDLELSPTEQAQARELANDLMNSPHYRPGMRERAPKAELALRDAAEIVATDRGRRE